MARIAGSVAIPIADVPSQVAAIKRVARVPIVIAIGPMMARPRGLKASEPNQS